MSKPRTLKCPTCDGTGNIDAETASVGVIIAIRRKELGMTQQSLATAVGMGRASIANIETLRHSPTIHQIRPLAVALKLSPESLLP